MKRDGDLEHLVRNSGQRLLKSNNILSA